MMIAYPPRDRHGPDLASIVLALALLLTAPLAGAQPSCSDLDAPVPQQVYDFAQGSFEVMRWSMNVGTLRPTVPVAGWPYVGGLQWYFQYPPDWQLRERSPVHAWVSDQRDLVHMIFVQTAQVDGYYDLNGLYGLVLTEAIAPGSGCDRVTTIATDSTSMLGQGINAGQTQAWVFRWMHPQYGPMIGNIQVMLQAQGIYTQYGYSLTSAPEAELASVAEQMFGPMTFSFYAAGFAGASEQDADGDGHGDSDDQHPADPERH